MALGMEEVPSEAMADIPTICHEGVRLTPENEKFLS